MPELVTIDAGLAFSQQQVINAIKRAVPGGGINVPINIKDGASLPLGKITGQTKDFDKALQAATDRVVAFGAAAGAFTLVAKGVKELAAATIEVQDSLIRIGANFNRSDKEIKQFGATLFDIARQTGNTFADAAKGAEELARQGLSIAETQKRLKDALVLSRISGTDVNDTIQNLTATLNTFNEAGLDSTKIINKLVAVDVSAAVSAKDLQEAFARVGSSAADAGVSFDQLLSLITVVKERTGRDGPVIGNALKTIFTRLEDTKTLEVLRSVGVEVQDIKGHTLPAVQILTELAKTYKTLGDTTQATVAKQVAGGFQVNILKSLLGDLSKETTRYSEVLQTASNASDEATQKNEKFNTSLKATLNATAQSITQIFSAIGDQSGGNLSGLLNGFNDFISKGLSAEKGGEAGKTFAQGFVDGISNVLSGPALAAAGAILIKVITVLGIRIKDELQGYLGISNELRTQAAFHAQIVALQERATQGELAQLAATTSVSERLALILALKERIATTTRISESAEIGLYQRASRSAPHLAGGYLGSAIGREISAIRAGVGGATSGAKPVVIPNFNGKGPIVANTDEYLVPNHAGGGMSVYNRDMAAKYGLPGGSTKISGPVGNYATARDSRGRFLPDDPSVPSSYQAALRRAGVSETEVRASVGNLVSASQAAIKRSVEYDKAIDESAKAALKLAQEQKNLAATLAKENKQIVRGTDYKASPETNIAFLAQRRANAGFGRDYQPTSFGSNLIGENKSIRELTLINQAAAKLKEGGNFGGLSKDERGAFVRGLRQQGARELYGSKFTLETLQSNPDAEDAIRKFVEQKVASFSPKRPVSLNSFLGENLSVGQKLLSSVGGGNVEKQLEKLISSKGVNAADAKTLREQVLSAQQSRSSRLSNVSLGAAFALPFISGFLPEGKGGTIKGQALAGVSGAAQGAGLGGILGPYGLLAGGIIGGFIGAMSKATKSLGEFQEEIDKTSSRNAQQLQSTTSAIEIGGQYQNALKSGDKSGAAKLLSQLNTTLGGVSDSGVRDLILSGKLKEAQEASERFAVKDQQRKLASNAAQAIRGGTFQQGSERKDALSLLVGSGLSADDNVKNKLKKFASDTSLFQSKNETVTDFEGSQQVANFDDAYKNLNDLSDTLISINPVFKDLKINLDDAQAVARLFATALAQGAQDQKKVNEGLVEAAKTLKLTGFLTGGLGGTGSYGKYGASKFATKYAGNKDLKDYNKNENFLNLITELGSETPEGKFPNADNDPDIKAAKAGVQRKNLLQRSAEFLGARSGRPGSYFNSNGLASETLVTQGLERVSTQGDAQSKIIAKFLYEKLKLSNEDKKQFEPSPYQPKNPQPSTITSNGKTYDVKSLNLASRAGISPESAGLGIDVNNTANALIKSAQELAKVADKISDIKINTNNDFNVNVSFDGAAIQTISQANSDAIKTELYAAINAVAKRISDMQLERRTSIPNPPDSTNGRRPISGPSAE